MPARKATRKSKAGARANAGQTIDATLARLERELPPNVARVVSQLRARLRSLEAHLDRARSDSERRWERQQRQLRGDLVKLLQRVERAVAPGHKSAPAARKAKPARKAKAASTAPSPAVPAPSQAQIPIA